MSLSSIVNPLWIRFLPENSVSGGTLLLRRTDQKSWTTLRFEFTTCSPFEGFLAFKQRLYRLYKKKGKHGSFEEGNITTNNNILVSNLEEIIDRPGFAKWIRKREKKVDGQVFSRVSQLLAARHILSSIFADRHKSSKRRASCSVHILPLFLRKAGIDRWKTVVAAHNSVFLPPAVVDPSHSGPLFTHSWIDPDPYKPYSFRISSIFFCSTLLLA